MSINLSELQKQLYSMPEFELIMKIKTFRNSLNIFNGNYREIRNLIEYYMNNGMDLMSIRNRDKLHQLQGEVARLLHNFVAAAMSLVDHSRVHFNSLYSGKNLFPEYEVEIKNRFAEDTLHNFVISLRQYCQHYKTPAIISELNVSYKPTSISYTLLLDKNELLKFSGWKSKAKEYLDNSDDRINILDLIDSYYKKINEFHNWFYEHELKIFKKEIATYQSKEKEYFSYAIPKLLNVSIFLDPIKENPDEAFVSIIDEQDFETINKNSSTPSEKAENIIKYIQAKADISDKIKEGIRQLYIKENT